MTEIETRHLIMLQGTSHPFSANMDSQDIPIDFTESTPSQPHIPSTQRDDSFKTVTFNSWGFKLLDVCHLRLFSLLALALHNTTNNIAVYKEILPIKMHHKYVTL